jgi:hypothetical protein
MKKVTNFLHRTWKILKEKRTNEKTFKKNFKQICRWNDQS